MSVYELGPPYETFQLIKAAPAASANSPPPGTIIAARPGLDCTWDSVKESVEDLERRFLTASIALRTDLLPREQASSFASRARTLGVCCVLPRPVPSADSLREQLTDLSDLPDRVVRWLRIAGFPIDREAGFAIRTMLVGATQRSTLAGVRRDRAVGRRSWQQRFKRLGLASPSRWFEVFHSLHVFLAVQTRPHSTVEKTAEHLGYNDAAALRRVFRTYVGEPPSVARSLLGWKWMVHEAMCRSGFSPPRRGVGVAGS